jgi:hypothetical protein
MLLLFYFILYLKYIINKDRVYIIICLVVNILWHVHRP